MLKFSIAMMTIDRAPKRNFLAETVANLARAGVFTSPHLGSFSVVDSGSEDLQFIYDAFNDVDRGVYIATGQRLPTANAAFALRMAVRFAEPGAWVLFLEDDIDVCAEFLEGTAMWLDEHSANQRVFPLGANYDFIDTAYRNGHTSWDYPIEAYYGTLAVAMRQDDAMTIARHLAGLAVGGQHPHSYDLHMADWARVHGVTHFLTPVPSFIQHIGSESVIRPGSEFHTYSSWRGREWTYQPKLKVGA